MHDLKWKISAFADLSAAELYTILQLRNEVFVVEQNCIFQDADNVDQLSFHISGRQQDAIIAYARIVPPGILYPEPSIGRVVTKPTHRQTGIGKLLMQYSIEHCYRLYGPTAITIGAQLYLENFYNNLGFQSIGDTYLEDNIPHIKMVKPFIANS
ncbi:MAG TPA: GNAT family N-acetyltransferase [Chitinophagaceae bacterium]|nr:GNAT family N-acetyltransferase [Chitinophagaceae bacterium]